MRKLSILFILLAMILETFVVSPMNVYAADVTSQIEIVNSEFTIKNSSGTVILPESTGEYLNIPRNASIEIEYDINLLDESPEGSEPPVEYNYDAGDTVIIQLPSQLSYIVGPEGYDLFYRDADGVITDIVMGKLTVASNGVATITFTDFVDNPLYNLGMKVWFNIKGTFSEDTLNNDTNEPIELTFDGEIIRIGIQEPEAPNVTVESSKSGVYDYDRNRIVWTVNVKTSGLLYNLEVVDTIGARHSYVPNSLKLDDVDVVPVIEGKAWTYIINEINGERSFTYETVPDPGVFDLETSVNRLISFNNSVKVFKDDVEKASAAAIVQTNWVIKSVGRDSSNPNRFNWVITVNTADATLTNAIITDILPAGLTPTTGSFRLRQPDGTRINLESSPTLELGKYNLDPQANGTTIIRYLFNGPITDDYALEFSTDVTDPLVLASNSSQIYSNQASLAWDNNGLGTPSDGISIGTNPGRVISKSVVGNNDSYDHLNNLRRESTWTIVLNQNALNISDAIFIDSIPAGSEYIDGSFTVDPAFPGGVLSYDEGTRELRYVFNAPVTTRVTITLKTRITDQSLYYRNNTVGIVNNAEFRGTGITGGSQTATSTRNTSSQMIGKTISNAYNYQTRKMTWRLVINRNQLDQTGVVVEDLLPAGMRLLPETIQFSTEDFDYSVITTVNPDSDLVSRDLLRIAFNETIDRQVIVSYETIAKEGMLLVDGDKNLTNSARYSSSTITVPLTTSATQRILNTILSKSGTYIQGSDYIQWGVTINPNEVTLRDVELVDELQDGLLLDVTSVRLYPMTLETNGYLTKVNEAVDVSKYVVSYDETTNIFKFTFKGQIDQAYRLEFVTDVTRDSLTVSNTIKLNGVGQTYDSVANNINVLVAEDDLSGGGSGVKGSIRIRKGAQQDASISLAGAVFGLYNSSGVKLTELTTNEEGIATFVNLGMRTYTLVELVAPYGYAVDPTPIRVRLNTSNPIVSVQQLNPLLTGSITLTKRVLDYEGNDIEMNEPFVIELTGLTYPEGETFNVIPGTPVRVEGLSLGLYTVSEVGADAYDVSISGSANLSVESRDQSITVTNQEVRGSIIIQKLIQNVDGSVDNRVQSFSVVVTGPSYPMGETFSISNAEALILDGLLMGKYSVQELNASNYKVTIDGDFELTKTAREIQITVTNRRKPDPIIPMLPKTGLDPYLWPSILGAFLILVGFVMRRKRNPLRK